MREPFGAGAVSQHEVLIRESIRSGRCANKTADVRFAIEELKYAYWQPSPTYEALCLGGCVCFHPFLFIGHQPVLAIRAGLPPKVWREIPRHIVNMCLTITEN
jgi:hypothetical protein